MTGDIDDINRIWRGVERRKWWAGWLAGFVWGALASSVVEMVFFN
jgi:hypothetical protein